MVDLERIGKSDVSQRTTACLSSFWRRGAVSVSAMKRSSFRRSMGMELRPSPKCPRFETTTISSLWKSFEEKEAGSSFFGTKATSTAPSVRSFSASPYVDSVACELPGHDRGGSSDAHVSRLEAIDIVDLHGEALERLHDGTCLGQEPFPFLREPYRAFCPLEQTYAPVLFKPLHHAAHR